MKKFNKFNPKTLLQLQKEVDKIEKLKNKILKAKQELDNINEENYWLRYTNKEAEEGLTQEEKWKIYELCEKIKYCNKD